MRHFIVITPFLAIISTVTVAYLLRLLFPSMNNLVQSIFILLFAGNFFYAENITDNPLLARATNRQVERKHILSAASNYLITNTNNSDRIALGEAGLIGYMMENDIVDMMCLNCHTITQSKQRFSISEYANYILDNKPKYIVLYKNVNENLNNKLITIYPVDKHIKNNMKFQQRYKFEKIISINHHPKYALVFYRRTT